MTQTRAVGRRIQYNKDNSCNISSVPALQQTTGPISICTAGPKYLYIYTVDMAVYFLIGRTQGVVVGAARFFENILIVSSDT